MPSDLTTALTNSYRTVPCPHFAIPRKTTFKVCWRIFLRCLVYCNEIELSG